VDQPGGDRILAMEKEPASPENLGMIQIDAEHRIVSMNRWAARELSVEAADWIGRPAPDLGGDLLDAGPLSDLLDHLANPYGFAEWEKEFPGDPPRVVRLRSVAQVAGYSILLEDVSEQRALESRSKGIVASAKDGMVVVDENGVIVWPNGRFGQLFGLHWRQFKGMRFQMAMDLVSECFSSRSDLIRFVRQAERGSESHAEEILEVTWPQRLVLQVSSRPISSERGRNIGRVWTFSDITRFKDMENELRVYASELESRVRDRTQELEKRNVELETARQKLEKAQHAFEEELDMAKQVQDGLLPETLPDFPGWSLAAEYMPTGKVGGDFFDVVPMDSDRVFLVMADVAGHGVPAALVTAMAKMAFLRYVRARETSVAEILRQVNSDLFRAVRTDHYLTAFAGILDLRTGVLKFCRACHPYPFLVRSATGTVERLTQRGGFFVGMFENAAYAEEEVLIAPGDLLFLYTDGLHESMDAAGRQFGLQRLEASILSSWMDGPKATIHNALAQRVGHAMGRFPNDDITVLALKRD
jgi:PAS domain S-box-containing protein